MPLNLFHEKYCMKFNVSKPQYQYVFVTAQSHSVHVHGQSVDHHASPERRRRRNVHSA